MLALRHTVRHIGRLQQNTRRFHVYRCVLDRELKIPDSPDDSASAIQPRKPLSRIPVGGVASSARRKSSTIEFLNWKAAAVFLIGGGILAWVFQREKRRLALRREAESKQGYGRPQIGGPFSLKDHDGNTFTQENLKNKFCLLYFGFSMCPDICPDELEKMAEIVDTLSKKGIEIQPIFITCDPARDSPQVLKEYLVEFHPKLLGLTGSYEDIKSVCKAYRVYFSTPPDVGPGQDYLVDHSIFFYLMDPEAQFMDALGRQYTTETAITRIKDLIDTWRPQAEREKGRKGVLGDLFG